MAWAIKALDLKLFLILIKERENGKFKSIVILLKSVDPKDVNKLTT